jgi:hypothetical protein
MCVGERQGLSREHWEFKPRDWPAALSHQTEFMFILIIFIIIILQLICFIISLSAFYNGWEKSALGFFTCWMIASSRPNVSALCA